MRAVTFIDTSVLCNVVPVPGRDQDREQVLEEFEVRMSVGEDFVLPITAVVETGNFIAQISDGRLRRETAKKYATILRFICDGKAPWILHDFAWDASFLSELLEGAGTEMTYVEHAVNQVGAGDLCILTEMRQFQSRSRAPATVWTLDQGLSVHG